MSEYCISEQDLGTLEALITLLATDIHAFELRNARNETRFNGAMQPTLRSSSNIRYSAIIDHLDKITERTRASKLNPVSHEDHPGIIPDKLKEYDRFADLDLNGDDV